MKGSWFSGAGRLLGFVGPTALFIFACGSDEAHREYLAALRGDEDGSTYEERVAHLDRAIDLEPDRPAYYEARALMRIDRRDFDTASDDLDAAIALGDRPYLRFLRGLVRCQLGDCGAALPDFDQAGSRRTDSSIAGGRWRSPRWAVSTMRSPMRNASSS
jgi:tetratricopeptide (TPR) repeat protein